MERAVRTQKYLSLVYRWIFGL